MWIAIRERTREIGTLRAIGMQRGGVLWMFLLESLLLGLFGTLAGAVAGVGGRGRAERAAHPRADLGAAVPDVATTCTWRFTAGAIVRAVILITVITGVGGAVPVAPRGAAQAGDAMSHFG